MAQDYNRKHYRKPQSNFSGQLIKFLSVFVLGYMAGSFFDFNRLGNWLSKSVINQPAKAPVSVAKTKTAAPKPKFEFYTLLSKDTPEKPAYEAPKAVKPAPTPPAAQAAAPAVAQALQTARPQSQTKESWLVQVASFNKRQDADNLKASLVLRGFDVIITPASRSGVTWFRVVIGPFGSRSEAEHSQSLLTRNVHIKGIVRKSDND